MAMSIPKRSVASVWRRKARTILIVLALGFSVSIAISVPAAMKAQGNVTESVVQIQRVGYQGMINLTATEILVEPPMPTFESRGGGMGMGMGMPSFAGSRYLNESMAVEIASMEGVDAAVCQLQTMVSLPSDTTTDQTGFQRRNFLQVIGVQLDTPIAEERNQLPSNLVEGRQLEEDDAGGIMIGSSLADQLGIGSGDTMELGDATFQVVGVYDSGTTAVLNQTGPGGGFRVRFAPSQAYMLLSDAQSLFDMTGEVSTVRVYATSVDEVDSVAQEITDTYGENVTVTTQASLLDRLSDVYRNVEDSVTSSLDQMQSTATQEIAISIIVGGVIVFSTMFYTVRERTKEIGILKALGFRDRDVMGQFMLEGIIISVIGGLAGVAIAAVGAPTLANLLLRPLSAAGGGGGGGMFPARMEQAVFQLSAPLNLGLILMGFGLAVVLGLVGSFYPALHASRQNPVEALRHE